MTKVNSTTTGHNRTPSKPKKPKKPHKDFPLTPHPSGLWCKKIKGKLHYFGSWTDDPKGVCALERWLAEKDDRLAGRIPRGRRAGDARETSAISSISSFLIEDVLAGPAANSRLTPTTHTRT